MILLLVQKILLLVLNIPNSFNEYYCVDFDWFQYIDSFYGKFRNFVVVLGYSFTDISAPSPPSSLQWNWIAPEFINITWEYSGTKRETVFYFVIILKSLLTIMKESCNQFDQIRLIVPGVSKPSFVFFLLLPFSLSFTFSFFLG